VSDLRSGIARIRPHLGRLCLFGLIVGGISGAIGYWAWQRFGAPPPGEMLAQGRELALDWLQSIPLPVYILAFAMLPSVGFPLSLFYLTVGAVCGHLGWGLALAWSCLASNMALAYWLARGVAHPLIERFIAVRGIRIPKITPRNQRKVTVLVRLSPLPFALQNFTLALGHVAFPLYMVWSFVVKAAIGTGVIVFGQSLLQGRFKMAFAGIFAVVGVMLLFSWWRRRQGAQVNMTPEANNGPSA